MRVIAELRDRIIKIDEWKCPEQTDARLLTAPNIPKPLRGITTELILGKDKWQEIVVGLKTRAHNHCDICGTCIKSRKLRVCEFCDLDKNKKTLTFKKYAVLCPLCYKGVHVTETTEEYFRCPSLRNTQQIMKVIEHSFRLINERNLVHKEDNRLCSAFLNTSSYKQTKKELEKLVKNYNVFFYKKASKGKWDSWKYIYEDKEYYSPYKNEADWDNARNASVLEGKKMALAVVSSEDGNAVRWVEVEKSLVSNNIESRKAKRNKKKKAKNKEAKRDPRIDKIIEGWQMINGLSQNEKNAIEIKQKTKKAQADFEVLRLKYKPKKVKATGNRTIGAQQLDGRKKNIKRSVHYDNLEKQTADNHSFGGGGKEHEPPSRSWKSIMREQRKLRKNGSTFEK